MLKNVWSDRVTSLGECAGCNKVSLTRVVNFRPFLSCTQDDNFSVIANKTHFMRKSTTMQNTRKLCYRKDDRAMRAI